MTGNASSQRDTRIDVFRALALLTIFINHVPGTIFEHFTHKNFGFSDSAEAFVLISGIAVGARLRAEVRAGQPAADHAEGVAARRRALRRPHHDDGGDAGHLLGRRALLLAARTS